MNAERRANEEVVVIGVVTCLGVLIWVLMPPLLMSYSTL